MLIRSEPRVCRWQLHLELLRTAIQLQCEVSEEVHHGEVFGERDDLPEQGRLNVRVNFLAVCLHGLTVYLSGPRATDPVGGLRLFHLGLRDAIETEAF